MTDGSDYYTKEGEVKYSEHKRNGNKRRVTDSMIWAFIRNEITSQLVKKLPAIHGTDRILT
jgi:hypothetical protein